MKITVVKKPPTAEKILRQSHFGLAVGLTKTAQEAKAAVEGSIRGKFTVRGSWLNNNSPVGIKIKPASYKDVNPSAEVRTRAGWIENQMKGGTFFPYGNYFAVPTENVRRTKTQLVQRSQRPANLKNAFTIKTRKANVLLLMQRKGRGKRKQAVAMYVLIPQKKLKAVDAFKEPIEKVLKRRLQLNVKTAIKNALQNIK